MDTAEQVESLLLRNSPTLYDPVTKAAVTCYLGEGYPDEEDEPGIALSLVEPGVLLDVLSSGDIEYPDEIFTGSQGSLDIISDGIVGYGNYLHYGTESFNMFMDAMAVSFDEPGRWLVVPGDKDETDFLINELVYATGRAWETPYISDLMEKGEIVSGDIDEVMRGACLFSPAQGVFIGYESSAQTPGGWNLVVLEVPGKQLTERLGSSAEYDYPYDEALYMAHNETCLPIQGHEEELRRLAGGIKAEQGRWVSYEGLGCAETCDAHGRIRMEVALPARERFVQTCTRSQHVNEVRQVLSNLSDHISLIDGFLHALDADTEIDAVIADAYRDAVATGESPEMVAKSIASDLLLSLVAATTPDVDGRTMLDEQETVPLTTLAEIAVSPERSTHEAR